MILSPLIQILISSRVRLSVGALWPGQFDTKKLTITLANLVCFSHQLQLHKFSYTFNIQSPKNENVLALSLIPPH